MENEIYLQIAENLAKKAGETCLALQKNLGEIRYKSVKDIVTIADLQSEKIIIEGLKKAFPTYSIRTEEAGIIAGEDSQFLWIIDPVDGTVNFSRNIPLWGISIALHYKNKPLIAVVYLPKLDEMYTAICGKGAFLNGQKIHVSPESNSLHALVSNGDFNVGNAEKINCENLKNFKAEAENFERVKCLGSAVIEGTFVAAGRLDAFVMTMSYPWDISAIALLVSEAGGKVSKIDGREIQFIDNEQVIFTNGILHEKLIDVLGYRQSN